MSDIPRTCALCEHCTINLGTSDFSDVTPGEAGSIVCSRKHEPWPDAHEGKVDLQHLAEVASACPDFQLLRLP